MVIAELGERLMKFSLFYFDGDGSRVAENSYQLLIDSAKFADENGFHALWSPERHFHAFGGLYPNPAVTNTALAMITNNVQLRSGSVVLPLHHPVRVAEDWAVIDNLSNGRVGIGFASGWTVDEFILSREPHGSRRSLLWKSYEQVKKLWAGEEVEFEEATGKTVKVKTLPRPLQPNLPAWIACQSTESFIEAGRNGANLLISLLGESLEEVTPKIAAYKEALAKAGHDPAMGKVSMMVHTFMGNDIEKTKDTVRAPFADYLRTHYHLLENLAKSMGVNVSLNDFTEDDLESLLEFGVEGFMQGRSIIGTPADCQPFIEKLRAAGVDEVACLIDFVEDYDLVMESLKYIAELKDLCADNAKAETTEEEVVLFG